MINIIHGLQNSRRSKFRSCCILPSIFYRYISFVILTDMMPSIIFLSKTRLTSNIHQNSVHKPTYTFIKMCITISVTTSRRLTQVYKEVRFSFTLNYIIYFCQLQSTVLILWWTKLFWDKERNALNGKTV